MKKHERRWRVSVFPLGVTDPAVGPLIHKSSARRETAEAHFFNFMRHLGTKYEMVILHQGKGGSLSMKIWLDTRIVGHIESVEQKIQFLQIRASNQRVDLEAM